MNHFAILMHFLRDRQQFMADIDKGVRLEIKIVSLLVCSSMFFALYGAIIGSFSGPLQMVSSAIKLPALYLITLFICLPTLYFFDVISGSKRTFPQYLTLLLTATAVISVMLFGFAPITLFFRLSINDYAFFKLLNVAIFAISGFIGVSFFYRGMLFFNNQNSDKTQDSENKKDAEKPNRSTQIVKAWLVLYAFVGSQLGWTLRPFFGAPNEPFQLFRELESNFYLHILKTFFEAIGLG